MINTDRTMVYDGVGGMLPGHKARFYADIRDSVVLDVGCGSGQAAVFLNRAGNVVDGITWSVEEAELARPHYRKLDLFDLADCLQLDAISQRYDVVLLGDILEHLAHPDLVLKILKAKLVAGGRMYISVPNIANIVPRLHLLAGNFDYADSGIMDITHLRFFTVASIRQLVENSGLNVIKTGYSCWNWNLVPVLVLDRLHLGSLHEAAKRVLVNWFPGLLATQIMLVATPAK